MKHIYTFAEIRGTRLAATTDRDGANLPGGYMAWKRLDRLAIAELDVAPERDVAAMGKAGDVMRDVRARGLFLTAAKAPG